MQMRTAGVLALVIMGVIAVVVVEAFYFFPSDPFLYLKGMSLVNADHVRGYDAYMAGRFSKHFLSYFALAWLLKEPIPSIVLAIVGLVLAWRSKTLELIDKLFLLLPPAALFVAHTFMADNLGFRYVIPVLPFGYLLGEARCSRRSVHMADDGGDRHSSRSAFVFQRGRLPAG